jgi:hypothetical protein
MSIIPHEMLQEMAQSVQITEPTSYFSGTMDRLCMQADDDFGAPPELIRLRNMEDSQEERGTWTRCCPICKEIMIKRHPPVEEVTCTKCGKYIWR